MFGEFDNIMWNDAERNFAISAGSVCLIIMLCKVAVNFVSVHKIFV